MSENNELMQNLRDWMAWAAKPEQAAKHIQLHAFLQDVHDTLTWQTRQINDYEALKAQRDEAVRLLFEVQVATANRTVQWSGDQDVLLSLIAFVANHPVDKEESKDGQ